MLSIVTTVCQRPQTETFLIDDKETWSRILATSLHTGSSFHLQQNCKEETVQKPLANQHDSESKGECDMAWKN